MNPLPRVSFVMAAYNCANTIAASVDSCLAQTHRDVEVVVVDDGSKDDTPRILASYGQRIRLITQANRGLPTARSNGMRAATGEYIAWMDDDDLAHPERARLGAMVLAAHPDVALVSSDFSAFSEEGEIEASHMRTYYGAVRRYNGVENLYPDVLEPVDGVKVRVGAVYDTLLAGNFVHPPTLLMRRADFGRTGWFDDSLRYASDYDMTLRIARLGRFAYLDKPLLRYRRSGKQMSHASAGGRIPLDNIQILDKVRREDPAAYERLAGTFRTRYARAYVEAAEYMEPLHRMRALGLLARSVPHGASPSEVARVFLKVMVPRSVVRGVKRALGGAGAARAS